MSKHWRPDDSIIEGPWTRPGDYGRFDATTPRRVVPVVLGAVLVGLLAGGAISWTGRGLKSAKPDSPIEWNAVQAVPRPVEDAEDVAWEQRAEASGLPTGQPEARTQAGSAPAPGARKILVIDGDTLTIGGEKIRIAGIDAPETHPPRCMDEARLGLAATEKLRQLLASGPVTVSGTIHDRYGREVREVHVGGRDVAEIMIGAGLARSYDGAKRQPWC